MARGALPRAAVDRGRAPHHRAGPPPPRLARAARARARAAARGRGRRAHAHARPACPAGRAHRDAPRRARGPRWPRAVPERRAPPAPAAAAARAVPVRAARRHARSRRALQLLARGTPLRVPARDRARRRDAGELAAPPRGGGRAAALAAGHAAAGARTHRARARADRRARLRGLFSHRARHREPRPLARHPLPGSRLGRQLRRVLLPRHHRGRPGAQPDAVRALHLARAQRAAGHRRRLRARAARGGDPVPLCEVRPPPRRPRGDRDLLPAEERAQGRREGHGPRPASGRRARPLDAVVGRLADRRGTRPRRRPRPGEPGARPRARAGADAARLPAPSLAARGRLRDRARPARGTGSGRERRDAGAHRHPVGQGRPRRARAPQGGRAGPRHAHRDPPCLRSRGASPRRALDARHRAARGPGRLRHDRPRRHRGRVPDRVAGADGDAAAPRRGRRWRCCRASGRAPTTTS